jgi:isopentenyl phosphate kinase
MTELVFLKLGGSLITDKTRPYTPRLEVLAGLAAQIAAVRNGTPGGPDGIRLVLGHGSGSFGHFAVKEYLRTVPRPGDPGRKTPADEGYWRGFAEVWFRVSQLDRHVIEALHAAGVPAVALPASALVGALNGTIVSWDLTSLRAALEAGLVPVIHGDVVFDSSAGGSVLSTEDLMEYLAHQLTPQRILLAGLEAAVWADYPKRGRKVETLTADSYKAIQDNVGASQGADVTGGMKSKVELMLRLVEEIPALTVQIFSGEQPGNLERALRGEHLGTVIRSRA